MWKNITGNLYSPPTFIHRDESPTVFKYTLDNTVEDVTNLPILTTYIAKLQFEEINPLIFQDLKVTTKHLGIVSGAYFPFPELPVANQNNSYTYGTSLYSTKKIEPLLCVTDKSDIFLDIQYIVSNASSYVSLLMFMNQEALTKIEIKSSILNTPQPLSKEVLISYPVNKTDTFIFTYRYKVYDSSLSIPLSVMNNFVNITFQSIRLVTHTFSDYDAIELIVCRDRTYKKLSELTVVLDVIGTGYQGFIAGTNCIGVL